MLKSELDPMMSGHHLYLYRHWPCEPASYMTRRRTDVVDQRYSIPEDTVDETRCLRQCNNKTGYWTFRGSLKFMFIGLQGGCGNHRNDDIA
jgi:hypothetical protein